MARPRRSTEESFYDVFSDFDVEDQAIALIVLEQIHRLAKRERKPRVVSAEVEPEQETLHPVRTA